MEEFQSTITIAPNNAVLDIEISFPYKHLQKCNSSLQIMKEVNSSSILELVKELLRIKNAKLPFGIAEKKTILSLQPIP